MRATSIRRALYAVVSCAVVIGCSGGGSGGGGQPDGGGTPPVVAVVITPSSTNVLAGAQTQFTATVTNATDTSVTWISSAGSITANGLFTAPSTPGQVNVTATSKADPSKSATAVVTITAPTGNPVATVSVNLTNSSVFTGTTTQASAVLKDASGNVLTGRTVTWTSSNTDVAAVNGAGTVTALEVGSATITAISEGRSGSVTVTVTLPPAVGVASVHIAVASTTIAVGETVQATATVLDGSGNPLSGRAISWNSSNPSAAYIDQSGHVTGIAVGTTSVSATAEGVSGSVTVAVIVPPPAPVASVTVVLSAPAIYVGETSQGTVVLKDAVGNVLAGRTVTWASSNTSVATVSSNGIVTAVSAGSAWITATSEALSGAASLSISAPTLTITPSTAVVIWGADPVTFSATLLGPRVPLPGRCLLWGSARSPQRQGLR